MPVFCADWPGIVVQVSASEGLAIMSAAVMTWCPASTAAWALQAWMQAPRRPAWLVVVIT